jgi:transposase InsO family protein
MARTTLFARQLIVERVAAGWPPAHVAEQLGISRATVYKWLRRWRQEGVPGLADRSSRPHCQPRRLGSETEQRILELRRSSHRGPVWLAAQLGVPASTIGRVLRRHQVPVLAAVDPITGEPVRRRHSGIRYEHRRPGDLLHVDVKKLGRVPEGGGWRLLGRDATVEHRHKKVPLGYDYLHVAVDDRTRLAYVEAHPDEKDVTCAGFLHRAVGWFRRHGVVVRRVLTDNAMSYRKGSCWSAVCSALQVRRRFTRPGCPWTNGKAERLNRTLLTEWAYRQVFLTNDERTAALAPWLEYYNTDRRHSALGGHPPISRLLPT